MLPVTPPPAGDGAHAVFEKVTNAGVGTTNDPSSTTARRTQSGRARSTFRGREGSGRRGRLTSGGTGGVQGRRPTPCDAVVVGTGSLHICPEPQNAHHPE